MIAFYIFSFCLLAIIMISFCLKSRKEKCTNFVDAFTFFSIPYFIYPFLGTYSAWKNNLYPDFVFYLFWISVIIGYVFFSIAYLFTAKPVYNIEDFLSEKKIKFVRMHHFILNQHIKLSDLIFFLAVFGVIIINIDSFISLFSNFGYGSGYTSHMYRPARTVFSGLTSQLNSYFLIFLISYPAYRIMKSNSVSLGDIVLELAVIMHCIVEGDRTSLIIIAISFAIILNYYHKKIGLLLIFIVGVFSLLFLCLLNLLRVESDIKSMLNILPYVINSLDLMHVNEFINPCKTFLDYIFSISTGKDIFNLGYTWIVDLMLYIPSFLFPNRPLPWAEQYMLDFYPGAPAGTGHGWFVLNDGYLSFGILGIILEMTFMGFIISKINFALLEKRRIPLYMLVYVLFLTQCFRVVRDSFLITVKNCLLDIVPFLFIILLVNMVVYRNSVKKK